MENVKSIEFGYSELSYEDMNQMSKDGDLYLEDVVKRRNEMDRDAYTSMPIDGIDLTEE
jgi:hypothetical protein